MAEVPVGSVSGVLEGCDPRVLLSLGVSLWLRRGELSEAYAWSDEIVLSIRKL